MTPPDNNRSLWGATSDHGDHGWLEPEPTRVQEAPPAPAPAPERPKRSRRVPGVRALVAVLALAVVALGGVVYGQHRSGGGGSETAKVTRISLPVVTGTTPESRAGSIYRQVQHGVVQIRTSDASGTGFVVDQNGTIVTNAHVVDSAKKVRVVFDDGTASVEGTVLGTDVSADLAAIKIDPSQVGQKLTVLGLADSDDVKTGDDVLAIGYPLGLDRTATEGIVSGLGRQIQAQNGFSIDKVIQTDASINPGNSGGPLIDSAGRVIGVNSQIAATAAGSNTGIGFSIPSNTVRTVIASITSGKKIARPYLGVSLQPTDDDTGAKVADVTAGGPGETAGLSASGGGDVITAIDGTSVSDPDSLIQALDEKTPGDKVTLTVKRDGGEKKIQVVLGDRPATAATSSGTTVEPTTPDSQNTPDPSFP
jgi:putative serine protease PepD